MTTIVAATTRTDTIATVLRPPARSTMEHPQWCDRGACRDLPGEPGYGNHASPGPGVVDQAAGVFWTTELRAPFLPGYAGKPEVHIRVIDLDEPEVPVSQSVRPVVGSRAATRLNAAVAGLERLLLVI